MNRWILLASALACLPAKVNAGVISRDWKTPGDGLLTYDDVNKREWLDLSQTILSDQFPGDDREAKYQYVAIHTGAGGLFEGFTIAKAVDVVALAQSAGVETATQNYAINVGPTLALGHLLGFTSEPPNGNKLLVGLVDEFGPFPMIRTTAYLRTSFTSQAGLTFDTPHTELIHPPGVMLFRAVPEPAAISVAMLGTLILTMSRRR